MVYAFVQDVPIREPQYRRIMAELGPEPMVGCLLHLCVQDADGRLRYIEVWEDEEHCSRAFEERIHPAVDRAFGGRRPTTEPTVDRLDVIDATGSLLPDGVGRS